jgi:DNA-binding transcriptional regulator YiaG
VSIRFVVLLYLANGDILTKKEMRVAMFAKRLAKLRKAKRLTQVIFANTFNIATGTIGMWESGKREPSYVMVEKIADFLTYPSTIY